ncbi:hypothetical protein GLOTRDRAFT_125085 [Gloeophyllum trabeum ATCC 11539]|uniref:HNH nuclease domain-containing protein n=1 Tax=Gloeophyllum trabeum (strain ATCC 11539 / FP-39264 / Madison 617) TaxID=670483 RepID=S7QPB4_GLOTA|nr:uncharacterized protein GLOTRDRAFT_125085 [Gloeophyllum trabeum ATCC 11539]EPQ61368.1 hypothetical protein GLOTRDRAFT_125085 [Gloeophyllum trabeum ATCC 11539]
MPSLQDINDKQNGFMCQGDLHRLLDKKQLAVLYTPNPILDCDDVPSRADVPKPRGREYPSFCCYTLQNLNILNEPDVCFWQDRLHNIVSKSLDGWFRELDRHKLPHPGLLHYVYGLSVLEAFGSASAWQNANAPWFRPKGQSQAFRQSHISQTMTDHETTHDKRFAQASPMQGSHPPAPKADEQGFVRITAEEAEDFVFRLSMIRLAQQEEAERQERNDIAQWARDLAASTP